MTRLEFDPHKFQEAIGYRNIAQSPLSVAQETALVLEIFFNEALNNTKPGMEYLAGSTLEYLYGAKKGFLRNFPEIDRTEKITPQDRERLLTLARPFLDYPDPEEDEAFRHSLVIFSVLPAMATSPYLPNGFSRRGLLAPPFTTTEYLTRLDELGEEVKKIIGGQTHPRTIIETSAPLIRTYSFFRVASNLPLHVELTPKEIEQRTKETVEKLLGDIQIDL